MLKKRVVLIVLGLISFMLVSCSDNPTSIGSDLLKNDLIDVHTLDSYKDSLSQTSSSFKKYISLGGSQRLFIGKYQNVESSTLLRFYFTLPDSIVQDIINNTATVKTASITLTKTYQFGDTTGGVLDFTAHKVNSSWNSGTVTGDSLASLNYDQNDISSNRKITDSTTTFDFDPNLAFQWLQAVADSNTASDYGILLKPTANSQKIFGYQSYIIGYTGYPNLKIVIVKQGSYEDTLSFDPALDAAVVTGTLPTVPAEDIVVQSGLIANSKLWFDVSKIPSSAIINHATLTLTGDSTYNQYGSYYSTSLYCYSMEDSTNVDSVAISSKELVYSGGKYSGDITAFVQRWITRQNNQGIRVVAGTQLSGFEIFALKGASASDRAVRPRLEITYTTKK